MNNTTTEIYEFKTRINALTAGLKQLELSEDAINHLAFDLTGLQDEAIEPILELFPNPIISGSITMANKGFPTGDIITMIITNVDTAAVLPEGGKILNIRHTNRFQEEILDAYFNLASADKWDKVKFREETGDTFFSLDDQQLQNLREAFSLLTFTDIIKFNNCTRYISEATTNVHIEIKVFENNHTMHDVIVNYVYYA